MSCNLGADRRTLEWWLALPFGVGWAAAGCGAEATRSKHLGVGRGADYDALRNAYVTSGTTANTLGDYVAKLVPWMKDRAPDTLLQQFGSTDVTAAQAYEAFQTLSALRQRLFLNEVYLDELRAPADKTGPSYLKYSRGYAAVNTLFPGARGYTANGLEGGASTGDMVHTGDLDLRLAAIETVNGGDISILGPGGRVLAGSVVSTTQQAARRNYVGYGLHSPQHGYGDFLLNQSRLFTVKGGDITMWSSKADLNAGQGAKTTPNFPPVAVRIGKNAFVEVDQAGATSGAGIAALPPGVGVEAPDAERGLQYRSSHPAVGGRAPGGQPAAAFRHHRRNPRLWRR